MAVKAPAIISEAFSDDSVSAFILYTICYGHFGTDIHSWEPETLWLEIQDDIKAIPSETNKDKIQAAIALVSTNKYYEDFQVFEGICKSFNSQSPDFEWITPLTPEECAWAVAESRLIDSTPEEYSEEIKAYVQEILRLGGMYLAPPQLTFANMSAKYQIERYVPKELLDKVELQQNIKLKKIELYIQMQRDNIERDLRKYFK